MQVTAHMTLCIMWHSAWIGGPRVWFNPLFHSNLHRRVSSHSLSRLPSRPLPKPPSQIKTTTMLEAKLQEAGTLKKLLDGTCRVFFRVVQSPTTRFPYTNNLLLTTQLHLFFFPVNSHQRTRNWRQLWMQRRRHRPPSHGQFPRRTRFCQVLVHLRSNGIAAIALCHSVSTWRV